MSKKNDGFTLAEVIIAVAVATLVGGLLLAILVSNTGLFYRQSARISQGLGINDALANLRQNIKESQSVSSGYPESATPSYSSSTSTLVLKVISVDSNGELLANTFDYFIYHAEDNKLRLKIYPNILSSRKNLDQVVVNNLESITFKYYDASRMEISPASAVKINASITLKQKAGTGFEVNTATVEASLRNN